MASVELRWRLGWCGLRGACRGERVCQFNSSLKNDVNVPSKSNKQKKIVFCWRLGGH
jgi:hypothetical protein